MAHRTATFSRHRDGFIRAVKRVARFDFHFHGNVGDRVIRSRRRLDAFVIPTPGFGIGKNIVSARDLRESTCGIFVVWVLIRVKTNGILTVSPSDLFDGRGRFYAEDLVWGSHRIILPFNNRGGDQPFSRPPPRGRGYGSEPGSRTPAVLKPLQHLF